MKPTPVEKLSSIVSLNVTIAKREDGIPKNLNDIGGNLYKPGFKK